MDNHIIYEALLKEEEELRKQIQELQINLRAIEVTTARYKPPYVNHFDKKAIVSNSDDSQIPNEFDRNWKQEQKVFWALNKVKEGFALEVGEELHNQQPEITLERATSMATLFLSKLKKDGKITYTKYGKRYKYSIK